MGIWLLLRLKLAKNPQEHGDVPMSPEDPLALPKQILEHVLEVAHGVAWGERGMQLAGLKGLGTAPPACLDLASEFRSPSAVLRAWSQPICDEPVTRLVQEIPELRLDLLHGLDGDCGHGLSSPQ